MKRKTILTLGAAATAAVIGAIAVPAIAAGPAVWGPGHMKQRMHGQEVRFMKGHGGADMMMQRGCHGGMGLGDLSENPVYQSFNADADGTVSTAELEAGLASGDARHGRAALHHVGRRRER